MSASGRLQRGRVRRSMIVSFLALALAACGSTILEEAGTQGGHRSAGPAVDADSSSALLTDPAVQPSATPTAGVDAAPAGVPDQSPTPANGEPPSTGSRSGVVGRGVSADRVRIGAYILDTSSGTGQLRGFQFGDTRRQIEAIAETIERDGGMAGRKIDLVFRTYQISEMGNAQAEQRACTAFTEDTEVFAVIHALNVYTPLLPACLAQRGTTFLTNGGGALDEAFLQEHAGYVYMPGGISLSRVARSWPLVLAEQGFLTSSSTIGLVRLDDPAFDAATEQFLKPALAEAGVRIAEEVEIARGGEQQGTTNAVLRFQTAGVDRVLIFDNAVLALYFVLQAQSQSYRPLYGFNSSNLPQFLAENSPPGYFTGSVSVGWASALDVADRQEDVRNAAATRCDELMRSIGQSNVDRSGRWVQRTMCDNLYFLDAALDRAVDITAAGMAEGVAALDRSFESAAAHTSRFERGRFDGADSVRYAYYDQGCNCMVYRTGPIAIR